MAQSWTELDAGDLPTTAEAPLGSGVLARIHGTLSTGSDVDLYLIRIDDPATFRCTTVGGTTIDTSLWMFGQDGRGIAFQEDDGTTVQSTLTGQFVSGPRLVLIGISSWDNDARDGSNQEIWQDLPWNTERQPDGPGAANPVDHWDLAGGGSGAYTMFLEGASFALPATADVPDVAWAWVVPSGSATPFVSGSYQRTSSGDPITVDRLATGKYRVNLPRMAPDSGVVHASAYNGNHSAVVSSWFTLGTPTIEAYIDVFDAAGALADLPFSIRYSRGGDPNRRDAYLWADQQTAASYTPSTYYMFNGNRGNATITRLGTGYYKATFPGLGTVAGTEYGNVQVTAYNSGSSLLRRAKVESWFHTGGAGLDIYVRTFDIAGAATDSRFVLSYNENAAPIPAHLGSGAHVWANNPTAASYTPNSLYTASNGTSGPQNAETIQRLSLGVYDVQLPNVAAFDSSNALVTAYGSGSEYATIRWWVSSGTGTAVRVWTFNAGGSPADAPFSLSYLTNRPAGSVATNTVIGTGCAGSILNATTRPRLGTSWTLQVDNSAVPTPISLLSFGFSNPAFPLGLLGAPGCFAYQDQVLLVSGVLPTLSYSIAVPVNSALIGVQVYAQGGALQPSVNALGLATSNGIRGQIGDV